MHHGELSDTLAPFSDTWLEALGKAVRGLTWRSDRRRFLVRHGKTVLGVRIHPQDAFQLLVSRSPEALTCGMWAVTQLRGSDTASWQ
jgi:hypothetical protein